METRACWLPVTLGPHSSSDVHPVCKLWILLDFRSPLSNARPWRFFGQQAHQPELEADGNSNICAKMCSDFGASPRDFSIIYTPYSPSFQKKKWPMPTSPQQWNPNNSSRQTQCKFIFPEQWSKTPGSGILDFAIHLTNYQLHKPDVFPSKGEITWNPPWFFSGLSYQLLKGRSLGGKSQQLHQPRSLTVRPWKVTGPQ